MISILVLRASFIRCPSLSACWGVHKISYLCICWWHIDLPVCILKPEIRNKMLFHQKVVLNRHSFRGIIFYAMWVVHFHLVHVCVFMGWGMRTMVVYTLLWETRQQMTWNVVQNNFHNDCPEFPCIISKHDKHPVPHSCSSTEENVCSIL